MLAHVEVPVVLFVLAGLLLLALMVVAVVKRTLQRWRQTRRWHHALAAETRAEHLLVRAGYTILGRQVHRRYSILVNEQPLAIDLRVDYLVWKKGATYVAEVKTGAQAPRLAYAPTRRQILEYLVAFDADGTLLIDGERNVIDHVTFPSRATAAVVPPEKKTFYLGLGLGIVIGLVVMLGFFIPAAQGP